MTDKIVFLDRDGTIIEEMGYINHFSRIRPLPEAIEAIKLFRQYGFKVVVLTNQAGVARGYFSEEALIEMNNYMLQRFENSGARIDALYYCPHHPEGKVEKYRIDCNCRKPKTGLIEKAVKELNLRLDKAWMIGDRMSDVELAKNAGIEATYVLTGYGTGDYVKVKGGFDVKPKLIFNNVLQAAQTIVKLLN
ncbi:MAG TPA: HAD family hydrolase [Desulfobacterales bacterium]|nr:HAD family hydrolase [Desulfobacterales bacterium]